MPLLPERELNKNHDFIQKFYGHLSSELSVMALENGERIGEKRLLETYKYIFNSKLDWTGPLNYFRNFMFYRVKPNCNVR